MLFLTNSTRKQVILNFKKEKPPTKLKQLCMFSYTLNLSTFVGCRMRQRKEKGTRVVKFLLEI